MSQEHPNACDQSQVAERSKTVDRKVQAHHDAVKHVLSTRLGRKFYWSLMCDCGVFQTSFTGNSKTFYLEGRREIGLRMMTDINNIQPEAYQLMLKEATEDMRNARSTN